MSNTQQQQEDPQYLQDGIDTLTQQYKAALADLTFNSKPIITGLTVRASNCPPGPITRLVLEHLAACPPSHKLPALYLVDSIVKNLGPAWSEAFVEAGVVDAFCSAYVAIGDELIRREFIRVLGLWWGVFPELPLRDIESRLRLKRSDTGTRSMNMNGGVNGGTSGAMANKMMMNTNYPTHHHPLPPPPMSQPGQVSQFGQVPQMGMPQYQHQQYQQHYPHIHHNRPPGYISSPGQILDTANAHHPYGGGVTAHASLMSFPPYPPMAAIPPGPPAPQSPPSSLSSKKLSQPTLTSLAHLQAILLSAPADAIPNPSYIADLLYRVAISGELEPSLMHDLDMRCRLPDRRPALDLIDYLLRSSHHGRADEHATSVVKGSIGHPIGHASSEQPREESHASHTIIYEDLPHQCKMCGVRFPSTPAGKEAYAVHLDAHFRRNMRLRERIKKVLARDWLPRLDAWCIGDEKSGTDEGAKQVAVFFNANKRAHDDQDDSGREGVEEEQGINVEGKDRTCALCHEQLDIYYDDDEDEWMFKGAVKMEGEGGEEGRVAHRKCIGSNNANVKRAKINA